MNMTNEQTERFVSAFERMADALEDVASSTDGISGAIIGAYNGTGQSAFWGMSQALFMMVNADNKGQGLHIIQEEPKNNKK
jgi:hypothetical protein